MNQEPTLYDILQAVQTMDTKLSITQEAVQTLDSKLSTTQQAVETLDTKLGATQEAVQTLDTKLSITQEAVQTLDSKLGATQEAVQTLDTKLGATQEAVQILDGKANTIQEMVEENREIIDFLKENAATKSDITQLDNKIDTVEHRLQQAVQILDGKVNTIQEMIEEDREIIDFLKENAATKSDIMRLDTNILQLDHKIDATEYRLKTEIKSTRNTMIEHVDGFVALYQKHEVELAAVVSRQQRLEQKVDTIIKHLGLQFA